MFRRVGRFGGRNIRRHRPDQVPDRVGRVVADTAEECIGPVEERFDVEHRIGVARFGSQFAVHTRRADRTAYPLVAERAVVEVAGHAEQREVSRGIFHTVDQEHVDLAVRKALDRIHEHHRLAQAVYRVVASFLPAAFVRDVAHHAADTLDTADHHVGQLRVFVQQRQRRHAQSVEADAGPVAFVGIRPPLVVVVAPHAQNRLFEQPAAQAVALRLGEGRVDPVVSQSEVGRTVAYPDIERESHLVVFNPVGPYARVDIFEIVRAEPPRIHLA